jgi:murein DD-endopeptidase MepM/ murein hydrolase activator NlpD
MPQVPRLRLLQARVDPGLNHPATSVTVPRMPRRPPATRRQAQRRRRRSEHRLRRFALLTFIAVVLLVTALLTAFGSSSADNAPTVVPAPAQRLLPAGTPTPLVIAKLGALRLQLPIPASRVTAIGFHAAGDGALALQPIGRQGNEGLLARLGHKLFGGESTGPTWYQLGGGEGPSTSGLDVGAAAGTEVYSPVDGRVVGVTPFVVNGEDWGSRIDIQPSSAPSVVVSLTHVDALPAGVRVGATVTASTTRLGAVRDLSNVERQALARYTNDTGDHVALEVHPAASSAF